MTFLELQEKPLRKNIFFRSENSGDKDSEMIKFYQFLLYARFLLHNQTKMH